MSGCPRQIFWGGTRRADDGPGLRGVGYVGVANPFRSDDGRGLSTLQLISPRPPSPRARPVHFKCIWQEGSRGGQVRGRKDNHRSFTTSHQPSRLIGQGGGLFPPGIWLKFMLKAFWASSTEVDATAWELFGCNLESKLFFAYLIGFTRKWIQNLLKCLDSGCLNSYYLLNLIKDQHMLISLTIIGKLQI